MLIIAVHGVLDNGEPTKSLRGALGPDQRRAAVTV
jgi:hypothetical protein